MSLQNVLQILVKLTLGNHWIIIDFEKQSKEDSAAQLVVHKLGTQIYGNDLGFESWQE